MALASQKRGPKVNPALAETRRFEQLTRENQRLQSQLDKAMLVIDVQKKVSVLPRMWLTASTYASRVKAKLNLQSDAELTYCALKNCMIQQHSAAVSRTTRGIPTTRLLSWQHHCDS